MKKSECNYHGKKFSEAMTMQRLGELSLFVAVRCSFSTIDLIASIRYRFSACVFSVKDVVTVVYRWKQCNAEKRGQESENDD
uniref:Transmembrane protein n=1 Tax=Syphacia muris TaxID=451379 RepID=A0A0N5A9W6_9BILA